MFAEQNCLDIARAFADERVTELIQDKIDSLPKPKEAPKGKGSKPRKTKHAKVKVPKKRRLLANKKQY